MTTSRGLHTDLVDAVTRLDERGGPARVRDLLYGETAVQGASPALIEMTSAVHIADGGIDAVTKFPFEITTLNLPARTLVWQVKTGHSKPSAAAELGCSAKHQAAQEEVARGADYVLVWTSDQPRETRLSLQKAFADEATKLRKGARVYVLVADDLAAWAWHHPQVLLEIMPLEGLRPVQALTGREVENGTTGVENQIRRYLGLPGAGALRITGPPGSGKSTAIRIACNTLSESLDILIASDPGGVSSELLTRLAHRKIDIGIVIERCPPHRAAALERLVPDSEGRLRLVTEDVEPGLSYFSRTEVLEVQPMMPNVDRRLLEALDIPPPIVAELVGSTGGNPMLLSAMATGEHALSTDVVQRMTEGLNRRALVAFAIMPPIDAQSDMDLISSVSEVPLATLEDTAEELAKRKLIIWAGYPRLPKALASAVMRDVLISRRAWINSLVQRLPDDLTATAIPPLAMAGRQAESLVEDLLRRTNTWTTDPTDEITLAHEILDRFAIVSSAIPAAPLAAAQRLYEFARRFPWTGQHGLALVAFPDFIRAAERLNESDERATLGARLVLELIVASGFQSGAVQSALRSMVHLNRTDERQRLESIRLYAEEIGGRAPDELAALDQPKDS